MNNQTSRDIKRHRERLDLILCLVMRPPNHMIYYLPPSVSSARGLLLTGKRSSNELSPNGHFIGKLPYLPQMHQVLRQGQKYTGTSYNGENTKPPGTRPEHPWVQSQQVWY
ncbi:hypothetical protein XENTR_v10015356 [Xenopus tropicalis]|nr:hypothetical protein XENTR_v10015356 [Xenopus tropicalis]